MRILYKPKTSASTKHQPSIGGCFPHLHAQNSVLFRRTSLKTAVSCSKDLERTVICVQLDERPTFQPPRNSPRRLAAQKNPPLPISCCASAAPPLSLSLCLGLCLCSHPLSRVFVSDVFVQRRVFSLINLGSLFVQTFCLCLRCLCTNTCV
jgi:hypothetical protein